jgi:hypothetical protein
MLRPRPNILAPINPVNAPIPRGCFIVIGQLFAVIDQDVTFLPATGCAFNITFQILTGSVHLIFNQPGAQGQQKHVNEFVLHCRYKLEVLEKAMQLDYNDEQI